MNERLEQKCIEYIDANFTIDEIMMADVSVFDRQYVFWIDDIYKLAKHFYNLALADVKGEVEKKLKHSRDSQAFSNRESRENGVDYYNSGSIDTLMKLEDFIDNLTK